MMTNDEAVTYIIRHCNPDYPKGKTEWETAINMAIDALRNSPTQMSGTLDAVSRRMVLDALHEYMNNMDYTVGHLHDVICNLPSAQPEIVRCNDCKFYSPMNKETKTGICNLTMHQNFGDDWSCAGAGRRTDGTACEV